MVENFKKLPLDVFIQMTEAGELSIEDILKTCNLSKEFIKYCNGRNQQLFRKILRQYNIEINNINPLFSTWRSKTLVKIQYF